MHATAVRGRRSVAARRTAGWQPRLKVPEPPQHGVSTGGRHRADSTIHAAQVHFPSLLHSHHLELRLEAIVLRVFTRLLMLQ
eukprot:3390046-Pleurochrysis_carterae.AAC.1